MRRAGSSNSLIERVYLEIGASAARTANVVIDQIRPRAKLIKIKVTYNDVSQLVFARKGHD